MKKIILIVFVVALSGALQAQNWEHNFETAKSRANKEGKNILLVFSGSDWCAPCMKLEKEIWDSEVFLKDSEEHFVLLRADFPKRKANKLTEEQQEHNDHLAEVYNKQGLFPLVVILDKTGKTLGTTGYKKTSPEEYVAMLHSLEK
ncbi:MAG TPA: thioredoxin family protein [Draconibacterium sp.]|nr:thioredoxin family protein [Draconibacterium sp.]